MRVTTVRRNHPFQREPHNEDHVLEFLVTRDFIKYGPVLEAGYGTNLRSADWFNKHGLVTLLVNNSTVATNVEEHLVPQRREGLKYFFYGDLVYASESPVPVNHVHLWGMWASDYINYSFEYVAAGEHAGQSIFSLIGGVEHDSSEKLTFDEYFEQKAKKALQAIHDVLTPEGTCLYVSSTYANLGYEGGSGKELKDGQRFLELARDYFPEAVVFQHSDATIDAILLKKKKFSMVFRYFNRDVLKQK